jgi:hypothetical protein
MTLIQRVVMHTILALVTLLVVWPLASCVFDQTQYASVSGAQVEPITTEPGKQVVAYYQVVLASDACVYTIERGFVDWSGIRWDAMPIVVAGRAGPQALGITTTVPMDAAGGLGMVRDRLTWACNAWQRIMPGGIDLPDLAVLVRR